MLQDAGVTLGEVVRRFGIEADVIRRTQARENVHWLVQAGSDRFVLRRYGRHNQERASIAWEQQVLTFLRGRGWPVAPALGDLVEADGRLYGLFPHLPGRDRRNAPGMFRRCGRALAELHTDLIDLKLEQRPCWKDSFEASRTADRRHLFADVLAPIDADAAARAIELAEAAEDALPAFATLPRMVIHSDLAPWNVRFAGSKVAALFDFELSRVDARIADLAWTRRGYHDEAVAGYLEHGSFSDSELGALHHFWIVWVLNGLLGTLAWPNVTRANLTWFLEQIAKTRPYAG